MYLNSVSVEEGCFKRLHGGKLGQLAIFQTLHM